MQRSKGNGQPRPGSPARREKSIGAALALAMLGFAGAALAQVAEPEPDPSRPASEELVACLLPAEINRLGQQLTILGARQKIETSRQDCLDRGGEVIDARAPAAEPTDQAR